MVEGEHSLKVSAPQLVWFGIQCLEYFELKDELMNKLVTEVIVENPRLHRVC